MTAHATAVPPLRRLGEALVAEILWVAAALLLHKEDLGEWRTSLIVGFGGAVVFSALAWGLGAGVRRGRLTPLQVCLLVSLLLHVAAGVALGGWIVVRHLDPEAPAEAMETALDSEALAQERVALRIRETVATLELPVDPVPATLAPSPVPEAAPLAGDVPFAAPRHAAPVLAPGPAPDLPRDAPVVPRPATAALEERVPRPPPEAAPAAELRLSNAGGGTPLDVAPPIQRLATSPRPAVDAPGVAPARASRPDLPPMAKAESPPGEATPKAYVLRDRERRATVLDRLGADERTEAAVERALEWLQRHQEADGRWSILRGRGRPGHDRAATATALMCFYGWGARHDRDGPYRAAASRGLAWLLQAQAHDGDFTGGKPAGMYDQGICTLALAEAYGVTRDPVLLEPLRRAVDFIVRAQNPSLGGWRYAPGAKDSDTSVVGWQMMALRASELAGVDVPEAAWRGAEAWLERVSAGAEGGLYGYSNRSPRPAMTAQGMLGRQILGARPEEPRQNVSAGYLTTHLPEARRPDFYYWYAASLALHQHQGEAWTRWNARVKEILLAKQELSGDARGSWNPEGPWGDACGRVITTALATLTLEVYYRYLPFHGQGPATR
ncbi:MAG TPA: hypothetical protein VEJ18_06515 [Planctomycetota bacterium]|nr:hypothetical protein [Planctomycetota bacterium]